MVPPQRYESKQEEIKSRESTRSKSRTVSTRSKSHEYMRSDRTTLRGLTLGQVNSKSFLVPHHRRSEGAATQLRPGVSTSSTSPALLTILACLFLWFAYCQGEAPGYIAVVALAFWTVFPSACVVAAASPYALWTAIEEVGEAIISGLARPVAASLLCLMPPVSCNAVGTSLASAPAAMEALAALVAPGNGSAGAPMRVDMLCAGSWCGKGSTHSFWFPHLEPPSEQPPSSQTTTNSTLSALSLCACGGEQTRMVCLPAQMLPRGRLLIARLCPSRFTPVQWNRLCRCYWGNTSSAPLHSAPLHPGSHLPLSRLYTIAQPPVVRTQGQLQAALQRVGAALVETGDFLDPGVVSSPASRLRQSTTCSSRAATSMASMPSLNQIRDVHNTSWVAISNNGNDAGPRLRKVSLSSNDNWQEAGAAWLTEALQPLGLNKSTWVDGTCVGPRIYQPAGLMRLQGVACQHWHGDAAQANSLPLRGSNDFAALPLSALHPLSPGGTTILIVPIDTRTPSQVFVPPGYVLIWRGDLEHAGDEFLGSENLALFTYILPPTSLFEMERDEDGATLTFGTGRKHSSLVLPVELRGCDQGAGVGPIGSFATCDLPSDGRLRTVQVPAVGTTVNRFTRFRYPRRPCQLASSLFRHCLA